MSQPFLGEIRMVGFNFPPYNWAACDGQILPIAQYSALFSLLGVQFGGNGTSNFGLPNMQGNIPVNQGQGPGLSPYSVGDTGGAPTVTLQQNQLPPHNHVMWIDTNTGTAGVPTNNLFAVPDVNPRFPNSQLYSTGGTPQVQMAAGSIAPQIGGSGSHNNLMPFQVQMFVIAMSGIFPVRQ